MSVSEVRHPNL